MGPLVEAIAERVASLVVEEMERREGGLDDDKLYRPSQVRKIVGIQQSRVYQALKSGELMGVRASGGWKIRGSDVRRWMQQVQNYG